MITIDISEVKRFLNNAKVLKRRNTLPILSFIKIECSGTDCKMIKHQINYFLVEQVSADFKKDQVILIEEDFLSDVVNKAEGKELVIYVDKGKVVIDDGFSKSIGCTENPVNFPVYGIENIEDKVILDSSVISSIGSAGRHTWQVNKDSNDPKSFVFSKKMNKSSYIIGVNPFSSYFMKLNDEIPSFEFDAEIVLTVSKENSVVFSQSEKYHYIQSINAIYGFAKQTVPNLDFSKVFNSLDTTKGFTVNRKRLLSNCEFAISRTKPPANAEICIEDLGDDIKITCFDGEREEIRNEVLKSEEKNVSFEPIRIDPKYLVISLKEIDSDVVKISDSDISIILTAPGEPNYLGAIGKLKVL